MKKEFIVERQGRSFVLFAGLLDVAHQQGLRSIHTEIVQVPLKENGSVAICTATVVLNIDGVERSFTGIGDAAPNNVSPAMQGCLLRMAETRAKARALRDAVNVAVTAVEELGDEDGGEASTNVRRSRQDVATDSTPVSVRSRTRVASQPIMDTGAVTDAQKTAIRSLSGRLGLDVEQVVRERYTLANLDLLSAGQASDLIRALNDRNTARPVRAA